MSDRNKLYLVSILGISRRAEDPTQPDKQVGRYIHIPMLIIEQSIDNAEEEACVQANRMFSKELGFVAKHIAVQPMPPEAYLQILQLSHQGLLADSDEPVEQAVYFECSLAEPDPDDDVIFEFGKLEN
jgi:hypothetical protein